MASQCTGKYAFTIIRLTRFLTLLAINCLQKRFPVNQPDLLAQWKIITGRDKTWVPALTHFLCSVHFHPSCFIEGQIRRLQPNSVPTRIKLTEFFKKRQPMQYEFIRRQLLSQPGITKVEVNDIVTCEFDKEALQAFAVPSSGKSNKKAGKKIVGKKRKRSKKETSSDEDDSYEEEEDEVETNIIWGASIKEEVDPLLLDSSDASPSHSEDNLMSEDPLRTDTPAEDISDPLQLNSPESMFPEPTIVDPSLIIASAKDSLQPEAQLNSPEDMLLEPTIVDPSLIIASAKDSLQPEALLNSPKDMSPEPTIVDPSLIIASAKDSSPKAISTDQLQRDSPENSMLSETTTNPVEQNTTSMEQQDTSLENSLPKETPLGEQASLDTIHEEKIFVNPLQVDETNLIPIQDLQPSKDTIHEEEIFVNSIQTDETEQELQSVPS